MQECFSKSNTNEFMKWFVQLIAPVLTGVKPAEILSFPSDENHRSRLDCIKSCIKLNKKLSSIEFSYCKKCTKLFIYNSCVLDEVLADKRNIRFLKENGYPEEYSLDVYVKHLMIKMQNGNIPEEIGVFLGYPLKDVIGFIGHSSLKLTKVKGWRVYGDPRLSDRKYNNFMEAKESIKRMLTQYSPDNILEVV